MTLPQDQEPEAETRELATLVDVVFKSPTNPWGIYRFRRNDGTTFSATGDFGKTVLYEEFVLYGIRVPDMEGGDLEVSRFTSKPPKSLNAIANYLSALTGASKSSTAKLVEHYGESTIEVLERSPELIGDSGIPENDIDRLINGWKTLRSDRLALSKIEMKGIPLYKLSRLERHFGNDVDLNHVLKSDPYCLYVFFDDLPFSKAMELAKQLGVSNLTESAVRGAVIAALRREAWLGHSVIEGAQLGQLVIKLLRVHPDGLRPLLPPAVAMLKRWDLIRVEDRKVQLKQLHDAEQRLFTQIAHWSQLRESDLDQDLVPSEMMGLKLLKPLKLKQGAAKDLLTGISALLSECFAIVQCQTYEDQVFVLKALALLFKANGVSVVFTTYTLEMLHDLQGSLEPDENVVSYAQLIGIDESTGIPLHRASSPVEAEAIVVIGADALGVEEMSLLIEAAPTDGRLYLLGCPKDLPSLSVGQPFADILDSGKFKAFHSRFWGIPQTDKQKAQEEVWSGTLAPTADEFDPTAPVSWFDCPDEQLPEVVPNMLRALGQELEMQSLMDFRVVAPTTAHPLIKKVQAAIVSEYSSDELPMKFQGRSVSLGVPIVVRQPLGGASCPAFSVYSPTEIAPRAITLQSICGSTSTISDDERLDLFDAVVMTPKFIRGRRYEIVILLAIEDQLDQINQELLSSLLNTASRSLIVIGCVRQIPADLSDRATNRTRSKLLNWISEK